MAHRPGSYLITNATVLDGTEDMEPRRNMALIIEEGKIQSIVPTALAMEPPLSKVIDLHGAYLMPGLVNMHAHFIGSGKPVSSGNAGDLFKKADNAAGHLLVENIIKGSAQQQLASGVTTVRGAGDPFFADITVRDSIEVGRYQGPRILAPGTGITVPGGHGAGLFAREVETPEEAAAMVRETVVEGADLIKLFITGGVYDATVPGEPGALRMSLPIARAACQTAHKYGKTVMAHVESTEGVRVALLAGVDTVEHGAPMTDEIRALYHGAAGTQLPGRMPSVTCTISPALPYVALDPEKTQSTEVQKLNADVVFTGIVESAREALADGIPVGLGTDSSCPYVTHYDMWREVAYFQKYAGVSNKFALHTATQVNAQLLGLGDVTGTIETGKDADLIVCDRNPLDDLSALSRVRYVMTRGKLVEKLRVKHMDELDQELDGIMARPAEDVLEQRRKEGAGLEDA